MQSGLRMRLNKTISFLQTPHNTLATHTHTLACLAFCFPSTSNCFLCQQYVFLHKVDQKHTSHCGIFARAILLS